MSLIDFDQIQEQIRKVGQCDYVIYPLATYGAYKILNLLFKGISGFYKSAIQPHLDFQQRYFDKDSYVLITGGSDGIGFAIAEYFANLKFNIVLISRSLSGLKEKSSLLEQKYGIQTQIISADLNNSNPEFFKYIWFKVKDLDIAILVNNVGGVPNFDFFKNQSQQDIQQTINLNIYSTSFLTSIFLPDMLNRSKNSAIINIGGGFDSLPITGFATIGGCKTFIAQFTNVLSEDLKYSNKKVDVLCFSPNTVQTRIQTNKNAVTASSAVNQALRSLGRRSYTKGHWKQALQNEFFQCPLGAIMKNKINSSTTQMINDKNKKK